MITPQLRFVVENYNIDSTGKQVFPILLNNVILSQNYLFTLGILNSTKQKRKINRKV
jgi:hypothetical protein